MDADKVFEEMQDADSWGDPVPARPRKSEKRKRGVVVSVRLTADELKAVEEAAQAEGLPVGTYMRMQALATVPSGRQCMASAGLAAIAGVGSLHGNGVFFPLATSIEEQLLQSTTIKSSVRVLPTHPYSEAEFHSTAL